MPKAICLSEHDPQSSGVYGRSATASEQRVRCEEGDILLDQRWLAYLFCHIFIEPIVRRSKLVYVNARPSSRSSEFR